MKINNRKNKYSYRNLSLSRVSKPEPPSAVLNQRQLGTVGRAGEDAAACYLLENGYTIVSRNVRYGRKELDIIAEDEAHIVFVEVKTRTVPDNIGMSRFGAPSASVDADKRHNLIETARCWLSDNPRPGLFPRMDVIEVLMKKRTGTDNQRPYDSGSNPVSPKSESDNAADSFETVSVLHIKNAFGINY